MQIQSFAKHETFHKTFSGALTHRFGACDVRVADCSFRNEQRSRISHVLVTQILIKVHLLSRRSLNPDLPVLVGVHVVFTLPCHVRVCVCCVRMFVPCESRMCVSCPCSCSCSVLSNPFRMYSRSALRRYRSQFAGTDPCWGLFI